MNFKIDENLPVEAAELLRQAGHNATTVMEQGLAGSSDINLASVCQQENRALITLDVDFADIQAYPPAEFSGLIVLRLRRQDKPYVLQRLTRLIRMFSTEALERHLWIVEEEQVRVRS